MLEYDVEWPAQPGAEHSGHLREHGFLGNPTRNLGLGRDNNSGGQTVSPSNEVILLITQKPSDNAVAASLRRRAPMVLHSLAARRTPGWLQVKRSC